MSEDYLWDRSGPPDPEIEQLERTLAPLRYRHRGPELVPAPPRRRWPIAAAIGAIAAAITVGIVTVPRPQNTAWQVDGVNIRQGQLLRTGSTGVQLQAEQVGRVDLGPNSAMRATSGKRLQLQKGEMHAFIWAPAREFVVDTPSARAVDLGCEYTLNVDDRGDGLLKVKMGWVAFAISGREAFIPAGAQCATRKKSGPGIPYYQDSTESFRTAVTAFEHGTAAALPAILAQARPRDALTLWHLLTRVSASDRGPVFDRFAELVKVPGVAREAVLRQDPAAIDQCWNALNLENTGWWRGWERKWSE